jgi:transcriptional regulator with XRE-family HTH domain
MIRQIDIAKRTGLSRAEINRIVHGERSPSWRQAVYLAREFGGSVEWWIKASRDEIRDRLKIKVAA